MTPSLLDANNMRRQRLMQSLMNPGQGQAPQMPQMPRPSLPPQLQYGGGEGAPLGPDIKPPISSAPNPMAQNPPFGSGGVGDPNNAFNSRIQAILQTIAAGLPMGMGQPGQQQQQATPDAKQRFAQGLK